MNTTDYIMFAASVAMVAWLAVPAFIKYYRHRVLANRAR